MVTEDVDCDPIAPSADQLAALSELDRIVRTAGALTLVDAAGDQVALPASVVRLLRQALDALKRDQVVTVDRMLKDMTVAESARLLRVPRSEVVARMKDGTLPFRDRDEFRTIRFGDVMALKQQLDAKRSEILTDLARQGQEIERPMAEAAALRSGRRRAGV